VIDFLTLDGVRPQIFESASTELFRVDIALDESASPGEADAAESAVRGMGCDDLGDVQPWERRSSCNEGRA
jgi:hypothetical protein